MMVISAGTRNHFALDRLDRDDPSTSLDALVDGVELRIDPSLIGDRTFVNNASFGAYAQVVQSPAYRDEKTGTLLAMLPDLLTGRTRGAPGGPGRREGDNRRPAGSADQQLEETGDIAYQCARLDQACSASSALQISNAPQAGPLRAAQRSCNVTTLTAREVIIDADQLAQIPARGSTVKRSSCPPGALHDPSASTGCGCRSSAAGFPAS